jgi:hypothetical protein
MAYSNNGDATDITNKVDGSGKLNWIAPPGQWTLYALFVGLHGKMVERAAPGGEVCNRSFLFNRSKELFQKI